MAIQIITTQNVTLNLREAGLGPRILAYLLDWFFLGIWMLGCAIVISSIITDATLWLLLLAFIPVVFYDLLFEWLNNGQSPAKKILRIRVVNLDGTTPSFGTYLIRWLFRLLDFPMTNGALAVIMIAFTKKSQRLGDYLAGTTVISLKAETDSQALETPYFNFSPDYAVKYPDLLEKLNDKDINTIRNILNDYRYYNDWHTQKHLADKVRQATGYTYEGTDREFLLRILNDYNYLSLQ